MSKLLLDMAPLVSLVVFFLAFLWIAFRAYRPSAKTRLQTYALIPLREEHHDR